MLRLFTFPLAFLTFAPPSLAAQLYFVAIAEILPGKRAQYEKFVQTILPIWKRYDMHLVTRFKVIDWQSTGELKDAPDDVVLIEVGSREQFNTYLADPEYQRIKQDRIDAVGKLVVLEGHPVANTDRINFLEKAPLAAILFATNGKPDPEASLSLEISLVGQVKGSISPFIRQVQRLDFFPLSFDDNPMDYATVVDGEKILVMIGKNFSRMDK